MRNFLPIMILAAALALRNGIMVLVVMAFMVATSSLKSAFLSTLLLYTTNYKTDPEFCSRSRQYTPPISRFFGIQLGN